MERGTDAGGADLMTRRTLAAAVSYFAIVFSVAFVLGVVRTLFVAPQFGDVVAVMMEVPLILIFSWRAARWLVGRMSPPPLATERLAVGLVAFALLMAAETTLSVALFDRSLAQQFAAYAKLAGAIGLAGQMVFALIPLLARPRR